MSVSTTDETSRSETKMTPLERERLAAKLDQDLDDFISGLAKKGYKDTWTEENWQDEMEQHPFFRTKPLADTEELPPLIQGIQEIKYSPEMNSEEELALVFKQDGNRSFQVRNYRLAVANYTEALRKRHTNTALLTQLLSNRAAAEYHLQNYSSCRRDCRRALALTPGHVKALDRAIACCRRLRRYEEALSWCDSALAVCGGDDNDESKKRSRLMEERAAIECEWREARRDERREARLEAEREAEVQRLARTVASRGVRLSRGDDSVVEATLSALLDEPSLLTPALPAAESSVHLIDENLLAWPLLLLYPEFSQTDFIQEVSESDSVADVLAIVLQERASWDTQERYTPGTVHVYHENAIGGGLERVPPADTILALLQRPSYVVKCGVPSIVILPADSEFERQFLARNLPR